MCVGPRRCPIGTTIRSAAFIITVVQPLPFFANDVVPSVDSPGPVSVLVFLGGVKGPSMGVELGVRFW